jgi:hypothetical protein
MVQLGCHWVAGLDEFQDVHLATEDASMTPNKANKANNDGMLETKQQLLDGSAKEPTLPPCPASEPRCSRWGAFCQSHHAPNARCWDFDGPGASPFDWDDLLLGFPYKLELKDDPLRAASKVLHVSIPAIKSADEEAKAPFSVKLKPRSEHIHVRYRIVFLKRDAAKGKVIAMQRLYFGTYPNYWSLSLAVGEGVASLVEQRPTGPAPTDVQHNIRKLARIPGDKEWTTVDLQVHMAPMGKTAKVSLSLDDVPDLENLEYRPNHMGDDIALNMGADYLVGPMGETAFAVDDILIEQN